MDDPTPRSQVDRAKMIRTFNKVSVIVGLGYILPATLAIFAPFLNITFTGIHYLAVFVALAIGSCELVFSQKLKRTKETRWAHALLANQGVATLFLLLITVSIAMQSPDTVIANMNPDKVKELRSMCNEIEIELESIVSFTLQAVSILTGLFVLVFQVILLMYYSRTTKKLSQNLC